MTRRSTPADSRASDPRPKHIPVLLSEVQTALAPKDGETYIDATFGAGGYSSAVLEAANCHVLALDRDPNAVRDGAALTARFPGRFTIQHARFSQLAEVASKHLAAAGREPLADGVMFDIGVSSMQLDEAERGFSFQHDGPLDMRMSAQGMSAAEFLNTADEEDIAGVIYKYGEERKSRWIAHAIVKARKEKPFTRTLELAECVSRVFHGKRIDGKHPATRTFQAMRIYVNDELGELERGLAAAEEILKPGGRLVVVTFHSLEDRIVKRFLADRAGRAPGVSRYLPENIKVSEPSFQILNLRPLTPQKGELDVNPRARSARLRAAIRTAAPAIVETA